MKKLSSFLLLCFLALTPLFAQDECNPYYVLTEGRSWTTKTYSAKKDKLEGTQTFKVLSVEQVDGKLIATVNLLVYDKKEEEIMNKDVTFECKDGVVEMDMSSMIPPEMLESFKSMNMKMEMERMSIPQNLTVGQKLDSGSVKMTMVEPITMSMGFTIKDRKVESKETISVPAGDFEVFKISSITELKAMGTRETKSVDYLSEDVGMVRSERYNKKGELDSYTVLVSITK